MTTPILGVVVVKMPPTKTRPAFLGVEINPLKEDGKPMKRKGLIVTSKKMLVEFDKIIKDEKLFQLIEEIEDTNPEIIKSSNKRTLNM